jgi:hypothetical protein
MAKPRSCLLRLLVLVALLAAPIVLAPLLPLDSLKPQVESRLSATLGRKVTVGSLRLSFWGGPYLTISQMTAKEDPAFGEGDFLKADQVRADFSVRQYVLHRQITIDSLTIKSPEFTFIKNAGGAWSWTTIGQPAPVARKGLLAPRRALSLVLPAMLAGALSTARLNNVSIEGASVRLIDKTGAAPPESLYRNVSLRASMTPASDDAASASSRATGELRADSDEGDGAERLKAEMPFDLKIDRTAAAGLSVNGTVGPGPMETKNFTAKSFKLEGEIKTERATSTLSGNGHISAGEMFIPSINVSQQVASALKINQIGDMNPGTGIGGLETEFQVDQGVVATRDLRIEQLDGLGDATANQGWFKVEAALTLNYIATVVLSPDATRQVKTASPLIGIAVSIFQNNDRVSVPINITGDVRNPQIQVDVYRLF